MIVALAVLTLLSTATESPQAPEKTVTFACTAKPAVQVLKELSAIAGKKLLVSPQTEKDTLLIDVHDVPVSDLLKQIAYVTDAFWRDEGDATRLSRSQRQLNLEFQARQARLAKEYAEGISQLVADSHLGSPLDTAQIARAVQMASRSEDASVPNRQLAALFDKVYPQLPERRLLARILQDVGPARMAEVLPDTRIVYSTQPTQMQRELPIGTALDIYEQERQAELNSLGPLADNGTWTSDLSPLVTVSAPARFQLVLRRSLSDLTLGAVLNVYDSNNNLLTTNAKSFGTVRLARNELSTAASTKNVINWSAQTKQFFARLQGAKQAPEIEVAIRERALNPEAIDPLSGVVSESVLAAGHALAPQLVACLPDDAMIGASTLSRNPVVTKELCQKTLELYGTKFETSGDWALVMPKDPLSARLRWVDRHALGLLLRSVNARGTLPLDVLASYSQTSADMRFARVVRIELAMLGPSNADYPFSSWDALKLYGSMSSVVQNALWAGGSLPLQSFNSGQKQILEHLLFTAVTPVGLTNSLKASDPDHDDDLDNTVKLSFGIPVEGYISASPKEDIVAVPADEQGTTAAAMDSKRLAGYLEELDPPSTALDHLSYFVGHRRTLDLVFHLTPSLQFSERLTDLTIDRSKKLALTEFPDSFAEKVEATRRELRQRPQEADTDTMKPDISPP